MLSVCLVLKPAGQVDWRVFNRWADGVCGLQTWMLFSCLLNSTAH